MTKWLTFILLIIVGVAVFVPCCTTDNCLVDQDITTNTQNPIKSAGTCSPFFSCSSCACFVETAKSIQLTSLPFASPEHYEHLNTYFPSSFTRSLFQPPKFSI